jgi:hypothetical protein
MVAVAASFLLEIVRVDTLGLLADTIDVRL